MQACIMEVPSRRITFPVQWVTAVQGFHGQDTASLKWDAWDTHQRSTQVQVPYLDTVSPEYVLEFLWRMLLILERGGMLPHEACIWLKKYSCTNPFHTTYTCNLMKHSSVKYSGNISSISKLTKSTQYNMFKQHLNKHGDIINRGSKIKMLLL